MSKLVIEELRAGTGPAARPGHTVTVHYVGTLSDGSIFDSSRTRGKPFVFQLAKGQVIKGWDRGLVSMPVGSVRRLTIPPDMAYGAGGVPGTIPPNATLIFEVELLSVS